MPYPSKPTPTDWIVHSLGGLLLPGLLLFGWLYAPHAAQGPVICLWRRCFGWHCAGCGLTRALCLFATGQWGVSIRTNWLIIPGMIALLVIFLRSATWIFHVKSRPARSAGPT